MITLESLVEQGANVKLEVTPADLKMFAESIVQRTIMAQQEERDAAMKREAEETWLYTKQVRELLNVCEGTLNLWAKRGYLVPVKVGNKNMYAKSDVRRVQSLEVMDDQWLASDRQQRLGGMVGQRAHPFATPGGQNHRLHGTGRQRSTPRVRSRSRNPASSE